MGYIVAQITEIASRTIPQAPNVVLINGGTNDGIKNLDVAHTGERMDHLIDGLYEQIPGTTVILSTLLPNANASHAQVNTDWINDQYRAIFKRRQAQNQRIVLAEMVGAVTAAHMNTDDHTHPTDEGYVRMAEVWYEALIEAEWRQFLQRPKFPVNDTVCP